jgi:hypothetical protein
VNLSGRLSTIAMGYGRYHRDEMGGFNPRKAYPSSNIFKSHGPLTHLFGGLPHTKAIAALQLSPHYGSSASP